MKLDRARPYGEIFGGTTGAKYEQDGMMFDAAGDAMGNRAQAKPEVVPAADVAADQAAAAAPARRGNKKSPV